MISSANGVATVGIRAADGVGAIDGVGAADGGGAAVDNEQFGSISMVRRVTSDFTLVQYVRDMVQLCGIVLTSAFYFLPEGNTTQMYHHRKCAGVGQIFDTVRYTLRYAERG